MKTLLESAVLSASWLLTAQCQDNGGSLTPWHGLADCVLCHAQYQDANRGLLVLLRRSSWSAVQGPPPAWHQ